MTRRAWTPQAIMKLGVTMNLPTAADILGMSVTVAYDLCQKDQLPVPFYKTGKRITVPTAPILRLFGLEVPEAWPTPLPAAGLIVYDSYGNMGLIDPGSFIPVGTPEPQAETLSDEVQAWLHDGELAELDDETDSRDGPTN